MTDRILNPGISQVHSDISTELDQVLLERLQARTITAAELNVARQRLKDLGIDRAIDKDDPAKKMADELGLTGPDFAGQKIPEPCDEADIG